MTDVGRRAIHEKMYALDDRIHRDDELAIGAHIEHRRIVAYTKSYVRARRVPSEVTSDEFEFAERHGMRVAADSTSFRGPELFCRPIEHRIHVLVRVGCAEALREIDRLVDDDAIRHVAA